MDLDYSSLERALAVLKRSVHYLHSDLARENPELREQFRAATIHAFEFTFDAAIKVIRCRLSEIVSTPGDLHGVDFADLMRDAANAAIICDPLSYIRYREIRNGTSHAYNAEAAENTVAEMDRFIRDIGLLLNQLRKRTRETARHLTSGLGDRAKNSWLFSRICGLDRAREDLQVYDTRRVRRLRRT